MYREPLDDNAALNILGDEYNASHTYYLISDMDQFVIYDVDEKGQLFSEIKLDETPEEFPQEEQDTEDIFGITSNEHINSTKRMNVVTGLFWVIFALVIALVIAVIVFVLK